MTVTDDAEFDWEQYRRYFDKASDHNNDYQGTPVHLPDCRLVLNDRHPLREAYAEIDGPRDPEVIVGGPSDIDRTLPVDEQIQQAIARSFDGERVVNSWYSHKRNADVFIFQKTATGRAFAVCAPRAPDRSMDRFKLWIDTLGASDAWLLDAEYKAREKLRGLLSERQWRHYDLTGSFLETSHRSNLIYVFRRLRPTIAMSPRWPWFRNQPDSMRMLAVLCMHPIGYYERTWAGCLTPTDDVIAHVVFMRGDEAGYWKEANQHDAASPEAGI